MTILSDQLYEKILLPDENATIELGRKLAPLLKKNDVLWLSGPMGAGKTYMTKGIVSGLGGDIAQVVSPTFSLMNEYLCEKCTVIHCDFYRLERGVKLEEFGGLEFFDQEKITVVEWLERYGDLNLLPRKSLYRVHLELDAGRRYALIPISWKISREFKN
jgi:tRNA threonylcarbamoyladenosine biosynthesis protein TsaE